jgi:hypothetical protein
MVHHRTMFRVAAALGAAATAAAATSALAPSALAAPDNRHTIPVDVTCSDGSSYSLSTLDADSPWGAFHDVTTSEVFVPVYYSDVHVQVFMADDDRTPLFDDHTSDYNPRGAVPAALGEVKDCSFVITSREEDPDLGELLVRVDIELGLRVSPSVRSR